LAGAARLENGFGHCTSLDLVLSGRLALGPKGVAIAYSTTMMLWVFPLIAWAVHGTVISFRDVMRAASKPAISSVVAAGLAFTVRFFYGQSLSPIPRFALEICVLISRLQGSIVRNRSKGTLYGSHSRIDTPVSE